MGNGITADDKRAFKEWWHNVGSGIIPFKEADMESHAHRIAKAAWRAAQRRKVEEWKRKSITK